MKQFMLGLTLGVLVTGTVVRAAEFKLPEGSGGVPFSQVLGGVYTSSVLVTCGSFSPEALEQIRKAMRP